MSWVGVKMALGVHRDVLGGQIARLAYKVVVLFGELWIQFTDHG